MFPLLLTEGRTMSTHHFKPLKHQNIPSSGCFLLDSFVPSNVTANDPAVKVMTDLRKVASATTNQDVTLERAQQKMIQRGVRLLLVSTVENKIAGVLSSADILGEKPVLIAKEKGLPRAELKVSDVMTSTNHIQVISMKDVDSACVGDIVETLKDSARAHALVVDQVNGKLSLIGIFSATQIARQMGVQIQTHEMARTFAEIEALIAGV
jgi:predicted transcriptional regulator